jgi:hypothetical protein
MEAYSPGEEDYLRRDAGDGSSELQDVVFKQKGDSDKG